MHGMRGQALGHDPGRSQVEPVTWDGFFQEQLQAGAVAGSWLRSEGYTAEMRARGGMSFQPPCPGDGGYFSPVSLKVLVLAVITVILRRSQV